MVLWNEPDADRRRRMIAELWTEDGSQVLQPPQEMREIAASPGIGLAATLEARGHCELQSRATDDGSTAAAGHNVLVLAADGRVQRNYTFVDGA